jgi:hypothetical protein
MTLRPVAIHIKGGGPGHYSPFNGVLADWQNPLLKKVLKLVSGGYVRIGGTFTDYIHYAVPGTEYTACPLPTGEAQCTAGVPGNVQVRPPTKMFPGQGPCCLLLSMERWNETLEFMSETGMKVAYNLNALTGPDGKSRWPKSGTACGPPTPGWRDFPPWDATEAEALMTWTRENIAPEKWPSYWAGLRIGLAPTL